ncbi:MAG: radical SAM protein [archaeon]
MLEKIYYSIRKNHVKKPIYLIYFVTNICNSKCNHCFYSKQLNRPENKDLTLNEINNFSKQLGKLIWLSFSGGEPFMRKDITEVYNIFLKNNKFSNFTIPTNGILTDTIYKKTREMLMIKKIKSFSLNLSLDGPKEIHNQIRGVSCYDNVFKTYDKVKSLKKEFPFFSIKVSTTLSNKNINYLKELHKEVHNRMPEINFHNFEIMRGDAKNHDYNPPTIEELYKNKEIIFKIWDDYQFYDKKISSRIALNAKKEIFNTYIQILKTKKQPFMCYAGRIHAVLDNNGDIYFCELLNKIGNIRQKSFSEIWHSEEANKLRDSIKNRECYCTHSCFQNTNFIFKKSNWLKLVR